MLPPEVADPATLAADWFLAYTKSRSEKAVAWDMVRLGVSHFLPLAERTFVSGKRERNAFGVLFPSYVFFCGDERARLRILGNSRVAQVIRVPDRTQFVCEIGAIHRALLAGLPVESYLGEVHGKRCRVTGGPLQGTEGIAIDGGNATRLLLTLTSVGQRIAVDLGGDLLEVIR